MEKKNKKRSKRKIAAIVCLILVAGAAGSAYSVFKMKFYDKSNYVRRGTYVAAANTEKKAKEGEKQDVEVRTSTEVSHSSTAAQKIHNASAVAVSSAPETEEGDSSRTLTSSSFRSSSVQKTTEKKESSMLGKMAKQFFSQKDTYNLLLLGVDRRVLEWQF